MPENYKSPDVTIQTAKSPAHGIRELIRSRHEEHIYGHMDAILRAGKVEDRMPAIERFEAIRGLLTALQASEGHGKLSISNIYVNAKTDGQVISLDSFFSVSPRQNAETVLPVNSVDALLNRIRADGFTAEPRISYPSGKMQIVLKATRSRRTEDVAALLRAESTEARHEAETRCANETVPGIALPFPLG